MVWRERMCLHLQYPQHSQISAWLLQPCWQHGACAATTSADPLRVLRAVRFATRFGFKPEADILQAAASDEVRNSASGCTQMRVCACRCCLDWLNGDGCCCCVVTAAALLFMAPITLAHVHP
jgi:hypothetical protein